ncbi:MAG TPA: ABC transporter ATP-binding protein [Spirochaetes bacterium]|nr:ABC transporter ATP-binding protein [Spirochaetota bacterium]
MSLALKGIKKTYPDFTIDVSVTAQKGELLTLLGPSGCGKTTTLHIIAGFIKPDKGDISINGKIVNALPPHMRRTGLVFQDYALFPNMNVSGNIAFGLQMLGWNRTDINNRVEELLHLIRLPGYGKRNVTELSGGEQQRVALARALAPSPGILLLDEPLSALDARLRKDLRRDVKRIQRELGITTVYVTHDQEEAFAISDKIAVMNDGRIEQTGNSFEIYNRPETRFVAEFVGTTNSIDAQVAGKTGMIYELKSLCGRFNVKFQGELTAGLKVSLLVRPEKCVLLDKGRTEKVNNYSNIVEGMVSNLEYLGDSTIIEVKLKNCVFSAKIPGTVPIDTGETVRIGFNPDDCWLI